MRTARAFVFGLGLLLGGCLLEDVEPERSLSGRTVVAILAEPAEAMPGEQVSYRAIVASPDGPDVELGASWSFCSTPRPLSENAAVSVACATEEELSIAAGGLEVQAVIPMDACARFGPETSAGFRPTDPDQSGGYYQPVRAALDGSVVIHRHRVRCALANAPFEVVQQFQREYQRNRAPGILALTARGASTARVVAGEVVELELSLAPDAVETYVVYDLAEARLIERTEKLEVRWHASAGELATDTSTPARGRATVRWEVPSAPGGVWIWAVLRDDRGGVSSFAQRFEAQ